MNKTKKILLYMLSFIFVTAIAFTAVNSLSESYAQDLRAYESDLSLSVSYNPDVSLTLTTTNVSGYAYQYWIKTKVSTDTGTDTIVDTRNQYIWQIIGTGFGSYTQTVDIDGSHLNADKNYEVMVRVKDTNGTPEITADDVIVEELYQVLTSTQVGQATIASVEVNGKAVENDYVIVNKADLLDVKVNANLVGLTYGIYYGDSETAIKTVAGNSDGDSNDKAGSFIGDNRIDISGLKAGLNFITVKAIGNNTAVKKINLYVYDEYVASARPVIESLEGIADTDTDGDGPDMAVDGLFYFTMKVKYADGTSIADIDKNKFTYKLTSGNGEVELISKTVNGAYLDVLFSVDYGSGKNGIYYTVGTVARTSINDSIDYDDKIIQYYSGYARTATLSQTVEVYDESTETYITCGTLNGKYIANAGNKIKITATESSDITGKTGTLQYAFYREDASGWVLIKNYSSSNELIWKPVRNGTYNIQARIMDSNAGSYEKAVTNTYVIGTGLSETDTLSVKVNDSYGNEVKGFLIAGMPYKIEASYNGALENVLYMFTLYNTNLGTVYLNTYTISPYYMFIAGKNDTYIITARVINASNYGFKDISESNEVTVLAATSETAVTGILQATGSPDRLYTRFATGQESNLTALTTATEQSFELGTDFYYTGSIQICGVELTDIATSALTPATSVRLVLDSNGYSFELKQGGVWTAVTTAFNGYSVVTVSIDANTVISLPVGNDYCTNLTFTEKYVLIKNRAASLYDSVASIAAYPAINSGNDNNNFNMRFCDANGSEIGTFPNAPTELRYNQAPTASNGSFYYVGSIKVCGVELSELLTNPSSKDLFSSSYGMARLVASNGLYRLDLVLKSTSAFSANWPAFNGYVAPTIEFGAGTAIIVLAQAANTVDSHVIEFPETIILVKNQAGYLAKDIQTVTAVTAQPEKSDFRFYFSGEEGQALTPKCGGDVRYNYIASQAYTKRFYYSGSIKICGVELSELTTNAASSSAVGTQYGTCARFSNQGTHYMFQIADKTGGTATLTSNWSVFNGYEKRTIEFAAGTVLMLFGTDGTTEFYKFVSTLTFEQAV